MEQAAALGNSQHTFLACGFDHHLALFTSWLIVVLDADGTLGLEPADVIECIIHI